MSYTLLGLLEPSPNYGYELKKLYDRLFGKDKPILSGQIYATLGRLRRDAKIVEIPDADNRAGPGRVKYAITERGRSALEVWLETPEAPSPHLRSALYVKTALAIMRDGDAAVYLDNQRRAHIARMRALTKQRRDSIISDVLLIDHLLFHLEADLRWIDLTASRLTKLKEELRA